MYCTKCGADLVSGAKFCSACGLALSDAPAPVAPKVTPKRDWDLHVKILGWILVIHAALTAAIGLVVMFIGPLLRTLMTENPGMFDMPNTGPPPEVLALIVPGALLVGVIFLILSIPHFAAGVGLLRFRNWGRILTLIISVLRVLEFPFGTATSIYAFWILLSQGGKDFYKEKAAQAEA